MENSTFKLCKTNYQFKSTKSKEKYFANLALKDEVKYREQFLEWSQEKSVVLESWEKLTFNLSFIILFFGTLFALSMSCSLLSLMTIITSIVSWISCFIIFKYRSAWDLSHDMIEEMMRDPYMFENFIEAAREIENEK